MFDVKSKKPQLGLFVVSTIFGAYTSQLCSSAKLLATPARGFASAKHRCASRTSTKSRAGGTFVSSAGTWGRTKDLSSISRMLYQLSYARA